MTAISVAPITATYAVLPSLVTAMPRGWRPTSISASV